MNDMFIDVSYCFYKLCNLWLYYRKGLELPKTSGELYVFNKYSTDEMKNKLRNFDEQYKKGNRPKNPFR